MKFIFRPVIILLLLLISIQQNPLLAQKSPKFRKVKKEEKAQLAEYAFTEGMKNYLLGNFPQALSYFEESKKLGGENAALYYMMAKIYIQKDKTDIALQYANKALKLDSQNKYYFLLVAEIYERQQNVAEALKIYKRLIAEIPKNEELYYNIAEIYYYQKNYEEALKVYDKLEPIFGKALPLTKRKQDIYIRLNKMDQAIAEGESLIKAYPDEVEYQISHAEFLFKNKMTDKAIVILEQIIKEHPEEAQARLVLSDIYQSQGNRAKSDEELETVFNNPDTDLKTKISIISGYLRARDTEYNSAKGVRLGELTIKAHPAESQAYAIYGETLLKAGKKEEGWKNFIKAAQLDNTSFNLWVQVINLDIELNKADSIIAHSEEALETFPNQAPLWLYNGLGNSLKKNYTKAVEMLEEGKKLSVGNMELLLQFNSQLADNYHYLKDYQKSDAAFEEVLKVDGNNNHALNNYSYFLSLRKDKLDLAKSLSEKLIKKYPNEPTYLDTHAWVLYQMKNYEEAKKYLELAIQKTNNGTIVEHYGDSLYQLGQKDLAVEQWRKAKTLGETSDFIDKKISDKKLYE
jgi:tetratricopeptide (TPR) repeat protein